MTADTFAGGVAKQLRFMTGIALVVVVRTQ